MKRLYFILSFTIISLTLSSCIKEEGPDGRDEYIGQWSVKDECQTGTSNYVIEIFKNRSDRDEILIEGNGLYGIGRQTYGIVTGIKFILPIQQVDVSSVPDIYYEFSGTGTIGPDTMIIDYQVLVVQDGIVAVVDTCRATCIRM